MGVMLRMIPAAAEASSRKFIGPNPLFRCWRECVGAAEVGTTKIKWNAG